MTCSADHMDHDAALAENNDMQGVQPVKMELESGMLPAEEIDAQEHNEIVAKEAAEQAVREEFDAQEHNEIVAKEAAEQAVREEFDAQEQDEIKTEIHSEFQKITDPKKKKKHMVLKVISLFLGVTLVSALALAFGALLILYKSPYKIGRNMFVTTVMETSAAKFLATWFLSDEEIDAIMASNTVDDFDQSTDQGQISISESTESASKNLEILNVSGQFCKGKLMIVQDPSRVYVATAPKLGEEGMRTDEIVKKENAIAGINAGGFEDENGMGDGGKPLGIVIKDGKLVSGSLTTEYNVIGFDENNVLTLGKFTGKQALERHIRDAVSFSPFLIINGQAATILGNAGGLNPRTVIGQRKDGSVLLLVLDGRQANSFGASFKDCIDIMLEHGAVNAANLDGGSSTVMVYENEIINTCASLYGPRQTPTAFVVKR